MTIGADLAEVLPELRAQAESLMLDSCTVSVIAGVATDALGTVTPVSTVVYTGRCKVQSADAQESNRVAGEAVYTVQRYAVHVPVGSFTPKVGQVITITDAALDPNLTGRVFRVVALLHKTAATAYRLAVEELT